MTTLLHFEDFTLGRSFAGGPYSVTRDEILEFAREFDPQPHHLDEEAAKHSLLGGLAASGWHTCAMTMRMFADALIPLAAARGGIGSPEGRWMKPVRPGDVLRLEAEVIETKATSKPFGFVTFACKVFNQREQVALIAMTPIIATRSGA
ncbi:MAG: MaoC family dehydratase [Alphaproteobacteria bacterium]|nr:MaoC family dehydratase [Alphaproteobacteria bacterium]MBV9693393.1 MaoC family dehydratase [Alphaproteobacteria bacterium]